MVGRSFAGDGLSLLLSADRLFSPAEEGEDGRGVTADRRWFATSRGVRYDDEDDDDDVDEVDVFVFHDGKLMVLQVGQ